jgi:ubiquinone/menaquinone biosynthesis C-methylase UbiE
MNVTAMKERSREALDRQASDYDLAPWSAHARSLHPSVLAAVDGHRFGRILDVGCGTGALLGRLLDLRPGFEAHGLDISPAMAEQSRRRLGERARIVVGDAELLPYDDDWFDLLLCVDSFHHYPRPTAVFAEMERVLRPGGRLVLADFRLWGPTRHLFNGLLHVLPYGDVHVYSPCELAVMAVEAGFGDLRWVKAGRRGQLLQAVAERDSDW